MLADYSILNEFCIIFQILYNKIIYIKTGFSSSKWTSKRELDVGTYCHLMSDGIKANYYLNTGCSLTNYKWTPFSNSFINIYQKFTGLNSAFENLDVLVMFTVWHSPLLKYLHI